MVQRKIDEISSGMPNVFYIANDILLQALISREKTIMKYKKRHSRYADRQMCSLTKMSPFRLTRIPFLGKVIS